MNLYAVSLLDGERNVWVGTQADAASARKKLLNAGFKRADIKTEDVEVPTNKAGLIEFLNKLK